MRHHEQALKGGIPSYAVLPSEIILAKHANFSKDSVELPDYTDGSHDYVTFAQTNFNRVSFYKQNLSYYDFTRGSFREANFEEANLTEADLRYADLTGADLGRANLTGAILKCANLFQANLTGAILTGARLNEARLDDVVGLHYPIACPSEGSFIGWKKAFVDNHVPIVIEEALIKLEIPEDAKRSSATTSECRTNKAKVLDIVLIESGLHSESAYSGYDTSFIYWIGETVEVPEFDENRFNECSTGIHFFIDREEAIRFKF